MQYTQLDITYESESYAVVQVDPIYSEIIRKSDSSKQLTEHPLTDKEVQLHDHWYVDAYLCQFFNRQYSKGVKRN